MSSSTSLTAFFTLVGCAVIMMASASPTIQRDLPPTTTEEQPTEPSTVVDTTLLPQEGVTMAAVAAPEDAEKPDDLSDIPEPVSTDSAAPEVYSLHVRSDVKYRYATTLVTSRVVNRGHKAAEVAFQFVLPENAFVSGFLIEVKGKVYKAYVKEKEEANREYQEAIEHGHTAAQVAVSARDSNLFAVSVNLEPRSKMTFNLTYEELLSRRLGLYDHIIHLITSDKVIRDMKVVVAIDEPQNITTVKVPEPSSGNEVMDPVSGGLVEVTRPSPTSALITYAPSLEQQQKLLSKKNKENSLSPNSGEESTTQRLRVQYDVDHHSASGEILLHDGYFVHFFAPTEKGAEKTLNKHVIFVLDTSGSMWGRKIQQLQEAMTLILDSLNTDGDYFSLVQFSDSVKVWSPLNKETENSQGIHLVTSQNIEKAKKYIKSMEALGGTNIAAALRSGLQIAALGLSGDPFRRTLEEQKYGGSLPQPLVIFLTDGEPTTGETRLSKILAGTRALNSEARAPIFSLAFGNDADFRFVKKLSLQNHAFARRIYEAADATLQLESFFQEVASPLLSNVTFSYVNPKVDPTSLTESTFHTYFAGTEVVIAGRVNDPTVSPDELGGIISSSSSTASMSTSSEPTKQEESSSKDETPLKPEIESEKPSQTEEEKMAQAEDDSTVPGGSPFLHDIIIPKFPPPRTPEPEIRKPEKGSLERLWAFLTIRQLLDKALAMEEEKDPWEPTTPTPPIDTTTTNSTLTMIGGLVPKEPTPPPTPKQKALQLALQYGFVTPLTSLVVVKPPEKGSVGSKPDSDTVNESLAEGKEKAPGYIQNKIVPVLALTSTRPGLGVHGFGFGGAAMSAAGIPGRPGYPGLLHAQAPASYRPPVHPIHATYRPTPIHPVAEMDSDSYESFDRTDSPQPLTIRDILWYRAHLSNGQLNVTQLGSNETLYAVDENHTWQENDTFGDCTTPLNQQGYCRHLATCVQDEFLTDYSKYIEYFCPIENMAGVCCPMNYLKHQDEEATTINTPLETTTIQESAN